MAETTAPTAQDWADYQAFKANKDAAAAAAEASLISFPDVLRRVVNGSLVWAHEGERTAALKAISKEFPDKAATTAPTQTPEQHAAAVNPHNADQGFSPAQVQAQADAQGRVPYVAV